MTEIVPFRMKSVVGNMNLGGKDSSTYQLKDELGKYHPFEVAIAVIFTIEELEVLRLSSEG